MSEREGYSEKLRTQFTSAFETTTDPLKSYEPIFDSLGADPFELFLTDGLDTGSLAEGTVVQYEVAYQQWSSYMDSVGRHPACPNDEHVRGFAHWLQVEQDNKSLLTVKKKIRCLGRAYRFWQDEPALPHTKQYNPFVLATKKMRWGTFEDTEDKSPPYIPRPKLREVLNSITDIRELLPIATQLKLGLRVGELHNIQLRDVNLQQPDLKRQYPSLGAHEQIRDRPNTVYIARNDERDGNKSAVSRILPLDDELRWAFARYLRMRPTWVETWLFLSKGGGQLNTQAVNRAWKETFHPEYAESSAYRAVTSHFGRHYFTSYWRKEHDLPRELVQYMRGDQLGEPDQRESWMRYYLHVYYEDIASLYRENIYDLGLREQDWATLTE